VNVIYLPTSAYELTGDMRYLVLADTMGQMFLRLFFDGGNPFSGASSVHDHYQAITGADTLMTALLKLSRLHGKSDNRPFLLWCDR
jgi:hypothetical protein